MTIIVFDDCVTTDRGGIIENKHDVHAAVVDASGRLLYCVGNPRRMTLARSAAKPAQALAILETGGCEQFGFDDADLALMCASHSSEERHISRALTMLNKVSVDEKDLRCGGHPALSDAVNRAWIKQDRSPTPVCSNCSGKHAGMLAGSRAIGSDFKNYHKPDHPIQLRVKRVVEELCGLDEHSLRWSIDGCNLPAPAFPLCYLAQIYATLADAADIVSENKHLASSRTSNVARIFRAMASYPELVGGEGRFCTLLMRTFEGVLIGKLGADGCYGIGVRASEQTQRIGAQGALGISVKIEDGSIEILYAVVLEILEQLQIGTPAMRAQLRVFHHLVRVNTVGVVTGRVSLDFKLRPVDPITTRVDARA